MSCTELDVDRALERLRIFPLPEVVLLPGTILPLHIFEPRYREMVKDCRADNDILAMATIVRDEAALARAESQRVTIHPTVGVGRIVFHQLLEDGRSIIILQGLMRARILEELAVDRPYRTVRAMRVDDHVSGRDDQTLLPTLRHLLAQLAQRLGPDAELDNLVRVCNQSVDPGWIADVVASALLGDTAARLALLDQRDPLKRLELVNEQLGTALERYAKPGGTPGSASN